MDPTMISYCGLNCNVCIAHLRQKNTCPGCQNMVATSRKSAQNCVIRNCEIRLSKQLIQCNGTCERFPCKRIKDLSKRYWDHYHVDMLANLEMIATKGMAAFLTQENEKWIYPNCGKRRSMHRDHCLSCGYILSDTEQ